MVLGRLVPYIKRNLVRIGTYIKSVFSLPNEDEIIQYLGSMYQGDDELYY